MWKEALMKSSVDCSFLCRPVPIVLVEYWKVAHYKKKLLKKLPKSGSSPIQFLDVFIKTLFKSFIFDPDSNGWHRSWTIAGSLAFKIVRKYRRNLRKLLVQRNKIHGSFDAIVVNYPAF